MPEVSHTVGKRRRAEAVGAKTVFIHRRNQSVPPATAIHRLVVHPGLVGTARQLWACSLWALGKDLSPIQSTDCTAESPPESVFALLWAVAFMPTPLFFRRRDVSNHAKSFQFTCNGPGRKSIEQKRDS